MSRQFAAWAYKSCSLIVLTGAVAWTTAVQAQTDNEPEAAAELTTAATDVDDPSPPVESATPTGKTPPPLPSPAEADEKAAADAADGDVADGDEAPALAAPANASSEASTDDQTEAELEPTDTPAGGTEAPTQRSALPAAPRASARDEQHVDRDAARRAIELQRQRTLERIYKDEADPSIRSRERSFETEVDVDPDRTADDVTDEADFRGTGIRWTTRSERLVVSDVEPKGPFAQIGLQPGDAIISIDGQLIRSEAAFNRWQADADLQERHRIIVLRDGRRQSLFTGEPAVAAREREAADSPLRPDSVEALPPPPEERAPAPRTVSLFGISLDRDAPGQAIVDKVEPRSAAAAAGVRPGDLIVALDGETVRSDEDFLAIAQELPRDARPTISVSRRVDIQLDDSRPARRNVVRTGVLDPIPRTTDREAAEPDLPPPPPRVIVVERPEYRNPPPPRQEERRPNLFRGRLFGR